MFRRLLNDEQYFSKLKAQKKTKDEGLWQKYFEKNEWIFGYGLGYLFLSGLDDKKLEQVVQGHSVVNHGKRVDALMKTKGIISNLCFVEIKIHTTKLLDTKPYRAGCWAPSKELAGAVAQVQGTVASAIDSLSTKISLDDAYGNPTGNEIYNYQPKSFLVIGSLEEFSGEHGVNKDQLRSFELFRKNTINPEIITFDELYERARFIVHHNES
ncbi:Shedu immune nuclease family protein [Photobacterium kishitanii]|uniref:Shedu immune nuclease family protein n=1 Tax=Photobacterium kishitanii TaxID=318456 RepID=UPI002739C7F5|nr:Shedu immune nuclease family protein [Photobacterium kishitanii]